MKKFLRSPWGAAIVTAVFFLAVMGGIAVMAKGMIKKMSTEAAANAAEHEGNHTVGTTTNSELISPQSATTNSEPTSPQSTATNTEPTLKASPQLILNNTNVPAAPDGINPSELTKINTTTIEVPAAQPNYPVDGNANDPPGNQTATPQKVTPTTAEPDAITPNADANQSENLHWSYEGKTGPFEWHKMKSDWAIAKAGIRQSPINILPEQTLALPTLKPVEFHYSGGLHLLRDNGHTIQVDIKNDKNYIVIDGQKYQLLQFHFHAMSEHEINGNAAKMEVHLVHKLVTEHDQEALGNPCIPAPESPAETQKKPQIPQDQLAVIGVMIESGPDAHGFIKDLWSDLNAVKPNDGGIRFRLDGPMSLLPPEGKRSYYRYNGSLTTPPCSENVLWTVMAEPIQFSAAQIKSFTDRYSNNARPVMEKKRRFILKFEDKPAGPVIRATPAVLAPKVIIPIPVTPGKTTLPPVPLPQINAPSIGVRGGIKLPGALPLPKSIPAPQPR
jgi:carbonic anhydrase